MKRILLLMLMLGWYCVIFAQDPLLKIMKEELNREMEVLEKAYPAPYWISYRVEETLEHKITASLGAIIFSSSHPSRGLTVQVRVGSPGLDNFHILNHIRPQETRAYALPLENNALSIKDMLWRVTDSEYKNSVNQYNLIQSGMKVVTSASDKAPDYTREKPVFYYDKPFSKGEQSFDKTYWENRMKKLSARFKTHSAILEATASIEYKIVRKYFVSTEGSEIVENLRYVRMYINASTKADDGMVLPLNKTYFASKLEGLPDDEVVIREIDSMITKLDKLRTAPVVTAYTGPVLLSGNAAGVFFHEIFGHRLEAQRMKNDSEGQTFKKMVDKAVLPAVLSVYDDPTLRQYDDNDLNGYYKYDEEGVEAQRVEVVKNGILKNFLMTRVPLDGFLKSNGHARANAGKFPVSRQSNLIVETSEKMSHEDLRRCLIEEAKKQGLEYGFYFAEVEGGFTKTTAFAPNAFNVMPTEVYKVFVDGRPDELIRGADIVGTPLVMFSSIKHAGGKPCIFTGMCGAESGSIPVTAISPDLFVTKIELQKKGKSDDKLPELPRPY